jgi:CRISPR/Cas system CSM-associated protein Csm3 (group 7 of RAMP superfamily)
MVEITVTLTLRSPLNIGSGAQHGTFTRRGMLKDADGWPYIPASALKGRWRHAVEQVAGALANERVCRTHREMCRAQPCIVCRIFGSPWLPGRLRFVDLTLSGPPAVKALYDKKERLKSSERTGIAVNRRRQVAQDDLLFDTELFLPGAPLAFSGALQGDITRAEAGLLLAGLKLVPALGRSKSGGLGWIEAQAAITAGGETWSPAALLAAWEGGRDG